MNFDTWLKVLITLAYACFIAFVPEMPSYYTFTVNCIGFSVTLTATILLIWFLVTRPTANINVLNRMVALYGISLLLGTLRTFSMSVYACFWNSDLQKRVKEYPMSTTLFMSLRWSLILSSFVIFSISAGRLLLFVKPVVFQEVPPNIGALVVFIVAVLASFVDMTYTWVFSTRNVSLEKSMHMVVFKAEMGIKQDLVEYDKANYGRNSTVETTEEKEPYYFLPMMQILIFGSLGLEITKVVYAITKEYIKLKKANRVKHQVNSPVVIQTQPPLLKNAMLVRSTEFVKEPKLDSKINRENTSDEENTEKATTETQQVGSASTTLYPNCSSNGTTINIKEAENQASGAAILVQAKILPSKDINLQKAIHVKPKENLAVVLQARNIILGNQQSKSVPNRCQDKQALPFFEIEKYEPIEEESSEQTEVETFELITEDTSQQIEEDANTNKQLNTLKLSVIGGSASQVSAENGSSNLDKKSIKKLKDIIRQLCMRTASLVTVFGLVGVISMVVSSFTYSSFSGSVVIQITMCRLVSYLLVVLLIFFDKDIFDFLKQKCHISSA